MRLQWSLMIFACDKCNQSFSTNKKLWAHIRKAHQTKQLYILVINKRHATCIISWHSLHFAHFSIWYPSTFIWLLLSGSEIGSLITMHSSQLKCLNGRQELGTWSSLSLSLVDPRDMLNKFLYAQKSLFIGENANANFFLPITTTSVSVTFEPIELVPS